MIRLPFVRRSTYEHERHMAEAYRESRDWWLNTAVEYSRELMAVREERDAAVAALEPFRRKRGAKGRFVGGAA